MAEEEIPWLTQPDLFLLSQSGVVQVWKCKRTISEAQIMKRKDFEYVDGVENHLNLIKPTLTQWDKDGYKKLVKYITERRLLVNGQGLVIAELPRFNPVDGKMDASVHPQFMWSLDIIALDEYMQHYTVRPIPFRPIQYLEDKNGPTRDVQEVELSPNELKLTAELEKENNDKKALEKEVTGLKDKKKGLEDNVTKLKGELAAKTKEADAAQQELDGVKSQLNGRVADLEGKNRILNDRITQLTAELDDLRRRIADLRQQLIRANNDKDALDRKISGLQDQLEKNKNKPGFEPSWMSNYWESDWVDFYGLKDMFNFEVNAEKAKKETQYRALLITSSGTNFGEDNTTNVGRNFFNGAKYDISGADFFFQFKVVDVARLSPNGYAKARFNPRIWGLLNNAGTLYAVRGTQGSGKD